MSAISAARCFRGSTCHCLATANRSRRGSCCEPDSQCCVWACDADSRSPAEAAEDSRAKTVAAMDRLEREISSSGFLVGESFTVADLTAGALFYPVVLPPEFPYPLVAEHDLPDSLREFLGSLAERPGGRWGRGDLPSPPRLVARADACVKRRGRRPIWRELTDRLAEPALAVEPASGRRSARSSPRQKGDEIERDRASVRRLGRPVTPAPARANPSDADCGLVKLVSALGRKRASRWSVDRLPSWTTRARGAAFPPGTTE